MADSTSHLDLLVSGQLQSEVTANALFRAISPAMAFARRERKSDDNFWTFFGARFNGGEVFGVTFELTLSATNYITCRLEDGQVSVSTDDTNWNDSDAHRRLYLVVCDSGGIDSYEDHRETRSLNV